MYSISTVVEMEGDAKRKAPTIWTRQATPFLRASDVGGGLAA